MPSKELLPDGSTYPLGSNESPQLSPEEVREKEVKEGVGVADRNKRAAFGPSIRQQTQSEILNLALLYKELGGNPFGVRRIPFSILRDMTTDSMIAYAFYYTIVPLINSNWTVECEDPQLAAAVDAAFRPINSRLVLSFANSLYYGYAPLIKNWKLGPLNAKYKDKNSSDPEEEKEVWDSNIDVLLPDLPTALAPENCIPRWNEYGAFDGFVYSPVPIPNPMLVGTAYIYGPTVQAGYLIPRESALWIVNESQENFGSIFGAPRTRRAYKFWWSFWARWAWADRSFEKKADPTILVRYPTDVSQGFDVNDPNKESPTLKTLENRALQVGKNIRSGSTAALPSDMMMNEEGKSTGAYQWDVKYLEGGENFDALNQSFAALQIEKLKAMMLPEQAFLDSNVTGQGSSQRYVATQMGEIYRESQQYLIDDYDNYKNRDLVPEFIASAFPDKVNIPCVIKTNSLGTQDSELVKQLITLVGQKNPEELHANIDDLLRQQQIPLESSSEINAKLKRHAEMAAKQKPGQNEKGGIQGENAGIEKTETGESIYVTPRMKLNLASGSHQDFLSSLPDIPPFKDAAVRSASLRLRKLMLDRYKKQIDSFAELIKNRAVIKLAEEQTVEEKKKVSAGMAKNLANSAVGAWIATQAADHPEILTLMNQILGKVVTASGVRELKLANLDTSLYDPTATDPWLRKYTGQNLKWIDDTVRKEFSKFLTQQLQEDADAEIAAKRFREHFADLPETHADRASKFETGEAYNKGMLHAALDAGISQVLLHDASDGTDLKTDSSCIDRNGKVMSPEEALNEKKLHPNCTLYFTYLTTENLSLQITDKIPDELNLSDDEPGIYDDKTETLYVREKYSDGAGEYMIILGEQFKF